MNFQEYKKQIKKTFILALPVSVGQLGHIMLGVEDSIMVGNVSTDDLAAASLVNGLFFLILVLGIGLSVIITPLVAMAKGSDDNEKCGVIFRQSFIVNVTFSILLVAITYFCADLIFYFDQDPLVAELANSYMKILSLSIFPFMIFQTYRQFVEGLSLTKPPMYIALIANVVNIFGNWVFIYGNLGLPELGLDGAGISSLSTRIFMAIGLIVYINKSPLHKIYKMSWKFFSVQKNIMFKILRLGLPSGFQYFFEVGAFAFAAIMIGWLGSAELAAHQIAINLASITYMIVLGVSSAGMILVGDAVGKKDIALARRAGFSSLVIAVMIMATSSLIFISLRKFLPTLYVNDVEVIEMASQLLIIASLFQLADGIQATGLGILRGITDVKIPMYLSIFAYWIIGMSAAYYLGFVADLNILGVWIGLSFGLFTAATIFTFRFHYKTKKMRNV